MERGNSFTTGFGITCGVIAALVLVGSLLAIAGMLGDLRLVDSGMATSAKQYATQALRRQGITALGKEAIAAEVDGEWCVSGSAVGRDNRLHEVFVSFRVATVGKTKRWQLQHLTIDGDAVVVDGEAFD